MEVPHGFRVHEISVRDQIRFKTVHELANILCNVKSPLGTVIGSTALSLHALGRTRTPADFDMTTQAEMGTICDRLREAQFIEIEGGFRGIKFHDNIQRGAEFRVTRRVDGLVQDRVTVQLARVWQGGDREVVRSPAREENLYVEPLSWIVTNKLHALFKKRNSSLVSSRTRDLFDLALVGMPRLEEMSALTQHNLGRLATEWSFPETPPSEWRGTWAKLGQELSVDLDLDRSWRLTSAYVRRLVF